MNDNIVLEGTIPVGTGKVPQEHPHPSALTIGGSSEVSVVGEGGILNTDGDTVVATSTLSEVVGLEVETSFGETVTVGDIVDGVGNVEGVDLGSGEVSSSGGGRVGVVGVDELAGGGLSTSTAGGTLVGDDVVTAERLVL